MLDLWTNRLHIDDLSEKWQKTARNLCPESSWFWVVFHNGRIYGVYLSAIDAANAITQLELLLAAEAEPEPESKVRALLRKKQKGS